METKATIVSALLILGLVIIALGILSWVSSVLTRYGMPDEAFVIVAGLLLIIFTMIAARLLEEK
jgi:energy-converting hydrogenase Eha subunit A